MMEYSKQFIAEVKIIFPEHDSIIKKAEEGDVGLVTEMYNVLGNPEDIFEMMISAETPKEQYEIELIIVKFKYFGHLFAEEIVETRMNKKGEISKKLSDDFAEHIKKISGNNNLDDLKDSLGINY